MTAMMILIAAVSLNESYELTRMKDNEDEPRLPVVRNYSLK